MEQQLVSAINERCDQQSQLRVTCLFDYLRGSRIVDNHVCT
jgi:hypothetical protein